MSIRVGLRPMGRVLRILARAYAAYAYFDAVGKIWLQEWGGYLDRVPGEVAVYVDAEPGLGGGYCDRE